MLRGIYTAAAGMDVEQARTQVLANNIANLATPGYRRDVVTFSSFLTHALYRLGEGRPAPVGRHDLGAAVDRVVTDFTPGPVANTGDAHHVAIAGEGFFAVETANGEAYTRDGSFGVDAEGYLVTATGNRVLGERGPIQVNGPFTVSAAGEVSAGGEVIDTLRIVAFDNPGALTKTGGNTFTDPGDAGARPAAGSRLMQGWLEQANTDLAQEMTDLIAATRSYQGAARLLRAHDQLLGRLVNEVGKV
ncbi:MAG: flagellar basal-body rod protein FlgF [Desulfotomaculales bacterium]